MKTFSSFASVTMPSPVDANGNFQNNFRYQPGGPGDIVVVRLFYQWPVYVSLLGFNLSEHGRQQAPAGRHRRVPQRTLLEAEQLVP